MEISTLIPKWKSNGKAEPVQNQHSLHVGEDIFKLITSSIEAAEKSICVAASWFTDMDLFNALLSKAEKNSHVAIKVVLDANHNNYYLPFKKLVDTGAVVKMKTVRSAYGKMHSKFCVVDDLKLISGSYNWSKNARNNNDENVIYTEDPRLVSEYLEQFNHLLETAEDFDPDNMHKIEDEETDTVANSNELEKSIADYEQLLDKLIYAQVHSYDDLKLRSMGKERCENCSGFAGNIPQELDNVYTNFLRDIKVANEKKEMIKSSLQEQLERSKGTLDLRAQNDISLLEREMDLKNHQEEREIAVVKSEMVILETQIENITQGEKTNIKDKIEANEAKVEELKSNNYRPKIAWYTFVPNIIFLLLVMTYCVIFYSSAAYILIFSQDDAKEARLMGRQVADPEIFDGDAIFKSLERGYISLFFVLLVPVFIMALIFVLNKIENKWGRYSLLILMIVLVDGFTAYKVAESIYNIDYLNGNESIPWVMNMVWSNSNFYLVFVFGLLALLTFEFLLGNIMKVLDARNRDIKYFKTKLEIDSWKQQIEQLKSQLAEVNSEINDRHAALTNYKDDLAHHERSIQRNEAEKERQQHAIEESTNYQKSVFDNITHINITRIENENFTFSTIYVLDRIAIFMGGWADALFEQFAVGIAERKSREAEEQVGRWRSLNLKSENN